MDRDCDGGVTASPAEQSALIRRLRQQLRVMQQEHEYYRNHYREFESVCWDLIQDVKQLRQESLDDSQTRLNTGVDYFFYRRHGPFSSTSEGQLSKHSSCAQRDTPSAELSSSALDGRTSSTPEPLHARTQPACPRMRGSPHLDQEAAQALMERLWTLRQWMGAMLESLERRGTACNSSTSCPTRQVLQQRQRAGLECSTDAAIRERAPELNGRGSAHLSSSCTPRPNSSAARQLHSVLDDLVLQFTRLQATLTDTLWSTAYPPALSTPAHTRKDHDVEVARLQAINAYLRCTLRGYEQKSDREKPRQVVRRPFTRSPTQNASAYTTRGPPGYVPAPEEGLFVAFHRKP